MVSASAWIYMVPFRPKCNWPMRRLVKAGLRRVKAGLFLLFLLPGFAWADQPLRLMIFGDSLVAGYGLDLSEAFPARLENSLRASGHDVDVINAGVSGDTTAGGLSRIDWALGDKPDAVMVVLGGNDALRGLPPEAMRDNLDGILGRTQDKGLPVLLAGMKAPLNMGSEYGADFDAAFHGALEEAQTRGGEVFFDPFFLEGVALMPELNQADGIHPNPEGVDQIVRRLMPLVERLLAAAVK
jgi:acyl-CoA thioesterase-1